MLSDRTLQLAMQAQEVALVFLSKDPGNRELGLRAYRAAQEIINQWDREQIEAMKLGAARQATASRGLERKA